MKFSFKCPCCNSDYNYKPQLDGKRIQLTASLICSGPAKALEDSKDPFADHLSNPLKFAPCTAFYLSSYRLPTNVKELTKIFDYCLLNPQKMQANRNCPFCGERLEYIFKDSWELHGKLLDRRTIAVRCTHCQLPNEDMAFLVVEMLNSKDHLDVDRKSLVNQMLSIIKPNMKEFVLRNKEEIIDRCMNYNEETEDEHLKLFRKLVLYTMTGVPFQKEEEENGEQS